MPDRWPRALTRAALRDVGYDAVGASTIETAQRLRAADTERAAVRLIVVDQAVLLGAGAQLNELLALHGTPVTLLLASATTKAPVGPWRLVLRRPVSVGDIVAAVQALLPLPVASRRPLD